MCGIIGYTGSRQAAGILIDGLRKMEYRGYDSAGIAVLYNGEIKVEKCSGRLSRLEEKISSEGAALPGSCGIGHTRWATHGAATDVNAHPHVSSDGRFAIIHNGIIENFAELREELTAGGYRFLSQTDTEVVAALLQQNYKGNFKDAVLKTVSRLAGAYSLGIACADFPGTLFAVKEATPMVIGFGIGENLFASDVTAIVSHTRNVSYLDEGEIAELTPDRVTVYDAVGREVEKPIIRITWDIEAAEKGGFEHFMLKEIMEQPAAVNAAISPRIKDGGIRLDDFTLSEEEMAGIDKIVITACGSAYYAGCSGKYAIEKLTRIPVEVQLASELRYSDPLIDEHTLLIVLSQSGETADTIAAMKEARARGARVLSIVNVVGSTIARLSDDVLYTWAGPEIAVATTKGYTTQLAVLYLFAIYAGRLTGRVSEEEYAQLIAELRTLPKLLQDAIDMNHGIPRLAKRYYLNRSVFFIGRNTDWAIALEGALKMKEISYIHAESYAAGELKHGTIALIEEGTPVVAVCCNGALLEKTMSNILEVKARGARVLALSCAENRQLISQANDFIFVPNVSTIFSAAVAIVPLQLLAYYVAKENGCDIDKPKNLAKSVTVE